MATAWTTEQLSFLNYGGTTYYFAPHELVYIGRPALSVNQIVQESEAGEIKVQVLDANVRELYQFAINKMHAADRTIDGVVIRGFETLETLITSTVNYRENVLNVKPSGIAGASFFSARYWASTFPAVKWVRQVGSAEYYGDGSDVLVFRKEI